MHTLRTAFLPACLALLAPPALCGGGDKLYAVSSSDNLIRHVDPITHQTLAAVAMVAPSATIKWANGLATHPLTGEVFVLLTVSGQTGRQLGKVVPATGAVSIVGNTGDNFAGLAFNAIGTLYGITGKGASVASSLYTLDKTTGVPTLVRTCTGGDYGETIGFDPASSRLLRLSGDAVQVCESIDLTTLTATPITLSGDHIAEGLSMTHLAGTNFLVIDLNDDVFVLNTAGVVKKVGVLGHSFAKGLTFTLPPASGAYFRHYGGAFAAPSGHVPAFAAAGSSAQGGLVRLGVFNGPPATPAAIVIGLAQNTVPVTPTCVLETFPILPEAIVLSLSGTAPGEGAASVSFTVPTGAITTDLYFQAVVVTSIPTLVSANAVHIRVP